MTLGFSPGSIDWDSTDEGLLVLPEYRLPPDGIGEFESTIVHS